MTDLSDFIPTEDTEDTIVVELVNPTNGKPLYNEDDTPMTITVYKRESGVYNYALRKVVNDKIALAKSEAEEEVSEEELFIKGYEFSEDSILDLFAKTTKDWNLTFGGEKPKFSFEVARKVYKAQFIRDQVDEAFSKDSDFSKA
jgi:hypothetical protein